MSRKQSRERKRKWCEAHPEHVAEKQDPKSFTFGHCVACGTPLCSKGGCANTGMCGPCCTGEADTAGEY